MFIRKMSHVILCLMLSLIILTAAGAQETIHPEGVEVPEEWVDTYTPEELGAIDRALWAGNLTRDDLKFRKDYTKAYECFPWVKDMMADPLSIAPDMDGLVDGIAYWRKFASSPLGEVINAFTYYPEENIDRVTRLFSKEYVDERSLMMPEIPEDSEDFIEQLESMISHGIELPFSEETGEMLREFLPEQMSWHDVFESPYSEDKHTEWEALLENESDDYLYKLASEFGMETLVMNYMWQCPDPLEWLPWVDEEFFPKREPTIIDTDYGRIGIGTYGDDEWEGDFAILIDPGGDDHYVDCRIGAAYGTDKHRVGYFVDMDGDDYYDCGDVNITLGAAVMGVAAFYDLGQGDDRYYAGSCSFGAAMCGVATFYDDGGSDTYEGKVYTQGAAGFGIGVMVDDSVHDAPEIPTDESTPDPIDIGAFDNDRYGAWTNSQAFARTKGIAICSNRRGNEIYEAGGVYLHAPLFADRYQSFSQGFAIGERGIDYAGGIALILDYDGNDKYLGDVYNQGVGYWYSAGLMYDVAGNDTYEMTQYGQGSGIHLAIGGLIDVAGNDCYMMHSGLGTGGSHDYAASMLHDRGGNDQYFGNTSCNGGSLTNSAVIFIDRSGNDTYAGRKSGGINIGRPARNFISIGVLIDLDGDDNYLGIMENDSLWSHTDVGVGWDSTPLPPPEIEVDEAGATEGESEIEYPEIIDYEGELNQEVFDELWDIATRWRVGENSRIVPKAVDRLIAFGPDVLPYVSDEFDNMRSGLALYAFNPIIAAFMEEHKEAAIGVLSENLLSDDEMRTRVAMAVISNQKVTDLEDDVAGMLDDVSPEMQRRAIGVLGALGSHAADEKLIANLFSSNDEALIKVCVETLFSLDVSCFDELRMLLGHPTITVRETLINRIVAKPELYADDLRIELIENVFPPAGLSFDTPPLNTTGLRSLLKVFAKADIEPDAEIIDAVAVLLINTDWGIRADAVWIVRHWEDLAEVMVKPEEGEGLLSRIKYPGLGKMIRGIMKKVDEMVDTETDPYVLFVLGEDE